MVALVAAMAALLLLAYNANPAQAAGDCSTTSGTTTCTYGSTGAEDTFVVPEGVSSVHVFATGAPGAVGTICHGLAPGGLGARVSGDLTGSRPAIPSTSTSAAPRPAGADCAAGVDCIGGFNGGGSAALRVVAAAVPQTCAPYLGDQIGSLTRG